MDGHILPVKLLLHGDLPIFLPKGGRSSALDPELNRRTSIKDFLEAQGIPHPEIHRLTVNNREQDFRYIVEAEDRIEVFPFPVPVDLTEGSLLRTPLRRITFAVDANVGKLARLLRVAGFDTFFDRNLDDQQLAEKTRQEERILLTRDRALLKRNSVVHGRLIRSGNPAGQLQEVISLYGLRAAIKPFSRCLLCNKILQPVDKNAVIERLEPLTRKYFNHFHICPGCNRIYWPGSHRDKMLKYLKGIYHDQ